MESVSRATHREKASSSSSSSLIRKKLEYEDFVEIFECSFSAPELDLSYLENRVGSAELRSSDYSKVFGGLDNDDVALPYEQVFGASSSNRHSKQRFPAGASSSSQKSGSLPPSGRTKRSSGEVSEQSTDDAKQRLDNNDVALPYQEMLGSNNTKPRFPVDASSPSQKSGSLPPSGRAKRSSGEVSDRPADDAKQPLNLSFNKTIQKSTETSNGKPQTTELQSVPGFTYFVDGSTQPQKKTGDTKPDQSLKREVSRTWSFSADVEAIKGKGGVDKIHTPEKLRSVNEFNLKSQPSKAPPIQSTSSSYASEKDAFGKISGENSPSLLDEELDQNSAAAVAATAMTKALEEAEEIMKIVRTITDPEGHLVFTKPMSESGSGVKDKKKTGVDHVATNYAKDENARENRERSDPIFTGVDGKFVPSFSNIDPPVNAGKAEVKRVTSNDEVAKDNREALSGLDNNVDLENKMEKGEVLEVNNEAADYPGLASNTESKDPNLMSRLVGNISSMLFGNKPGSSVQETETGNGNAEQIEKTLPPEKGNEDADLGNSFTKGVTGSPGHCQSTFDGSEGPENVSKVARDFDASHLIQEEGRIMEKGDEMSRSRLEYQLAEENECATVDTDECATVDTDICDNSVQQTEEMVNWSTVKKDEMEQEEVKIDTECVDECIENKHTHGGSFAGLETMTTQIEPQHVESDTEKMKIDPECVDECGENYHRRGGSFDVDETTITHVEPHHDCDSDMQPKKSTGGKEINMKEPENVCQTEEAENRENLAHELETDDYTNHVNKEEPELVPVIEVEKRDNLADELKLDEESNHVNDGDMQTSPVELEQREEKEISTFGTEVKADNAAEVEYSDVLWDSEKMTNSSGEEEKSEFGEAVYDKDIDEADDVVSSDASTISSENQQTHMSTVISDTKEACIELNDRTEEHQNEYTSDKENVTVQGVLETVSGTDEDKDADADADADAESIVRNHLQSNDEGLSFDNVNADNAVNLTKDQHAFETNGDGDVCAAEIQNQTSPDFQATDNKTADVDLYTRQKVCGQTSGSDEESVSTSSVDNVDGLSAHELQEGDELLNNKTSDSDELKDDIEETLNEKKHLDEQGVAAHSKSNNDIKDSVTEQKTEQNKENSTKVQKEDSKDNIQNFDKAERQQRVEAIKKKRERERDRRAVERAIREARERAFAEARERAERAAVEKAAAEARKRAMAEARENLDKASYDAKVRAERAAVERATVEARDRALEKAKTQIDRSAPEKSTSSSQNNGLKHSVSSSDIESVEGTNTESAQRRKAKLEKHQRIMERAAKALEEKNMRDLVAQKEQAERNRLSESLDAEIKRWVAGKEGNLRALLSTLQYILGTSSGWQPISLTEIITTPAVKKAYRKATLYVHPDKLQQRGASIQQKYICEKVFDLLKAAWNRFNSEER